MAHDAVLVHISMNKKRRAKKANKAMQEVTIIIRLAAGMWDGSGSTRESPNSGLLEGFPS